MSDEEAVEGHDRIPRRLAIIGGGSSGLITLKTAIETLPNWDVVCFEKSDRITGCWGNPYPGFVSTSTKYTTQFSCFAMYEATVSDDGGKSRDEFFVDDEYGKYLEKFADAFNLRTRVRLKHKIERLVRCPDDRGWLVECQTTEGGATLEPTSEKFDVVIICTGLASELRPIDSTVPSLSLARLNHPGGLSDVTGQRIVVFGGGESAVDYAQRLSRLILGNEVFLSLHSGIRVSPRYHPIRGVPSDFLRNRLMLSIHEDLRNWIGQRFVEARIKYQERFEQWFPSRNDKSRPHLPSTSLPDVTPEEHIQLAKKDWAFRLTKAAKDDLFNMFHNKSDDFLDSVARGRITIVGPPTDATCERFYQFASDESLEVRPDWVLPAVGYRSTLRDLAGDLIQLEDFYLGCSHVDFANLFLVGFARPIIGNIPSISEMQARYACGLISGQVERPASIVALNREERNRHAIRFSQLNRDAVYPVEMFPYCDALAYRMGIYPRVGSLKDFYSWLRLQLAPATTMHYWFKDAKTRRVYEAAPIYMPVTLIVLLLLLKPVDAVYRVITAIRKWANNVSSRRHALNAEDVA